VTSGYKIAEESIMADILIVDDSAAFRQMLKSIVLSRFPSMEIVGAKDGKEAIEKTREEPPRLIFMDVRLPGENGFQITRKIKAAHPEIPVIKMTSYESPEYRETAYDAGADSFLSKKSSSTEDILKKVESILFPN
jgi:two-component system OmpR family response regulator